MIRILFIACTLLMATLSVKAQSELDELRKRFFKATANENTRAEFYDYVRSLEPTIEVNCYKGAALTMMAGESYNPYTKLSRFNEGKELIEQSIEAKPEVEELRYVRFLIQSNAPSFLNYNSFIQEDFNIINNSSSQELWRKHFQEIISKRPDLIPSNG